MLDILGNNIRSYKLYLGGKLGKTEEVILQGYSLNILLHFYLDVVLCQIVVLSVSLILK